MLACRPARGGFAGLMRALPLAATNGVCSCGSGDLYDLMLSGPEEDPPPRSIASPPPLPASVPITPKVQGSATDAWLLLSPTSACAVLQSGYAVLGCRGKATEE
jgi:hypothetical protein